VMISVSVVTAVVLALVDRNDRLLAQLAAEARADALTGLLNRRGFEERAAMVLAWARREGGSIAVVTFDVDHFKRVNDRWGHEVGDRVLARTGRLLAARSRDIDVVARFGGEEFVVLLPGSDAGGAVAFAERVRLALAREEADGLPSVRVSAGIHVATAPAGIDVLLGGADSALYGAKRAGRDRTAVFGSAETGERGQGGGETRPAQARPARRGAHSDPAEIGVVGAGRSPGSPA